MPSVSDQIVKMGKKIDITFAKDTFGNLIPLLDKIGDAKLKPTFMSKLEIMNAQSSISEPLKLKYASLLKAIQTFLSGLRIFFGPLYLSVKTNYDAMLKTVMIYRFMTHFHEVTHKILKTLDNVYELDNCQNIKTSDTVMCADNWAYFLTDFARQTNRLPGEQRAVGSRIGNLAKMFGGV